MSESVESKLAALEKQVGALEDERAIQEVLARYGYNADACRDTEYVELFTADGAVDLVVSDQEMYDGVVRFEGRDEIERFITDPNSHHTPGYYGRSMHLQGNNIVVHFLTDNKAVVNSYSVTLFRGDDDSVEFKGIANNSWTLRKENGDWLIEERKRREVGGVEFAENLAATPS